jgi:hypothetical protein
LKDEKQEATTSMDERTRGPQSIPEKPVLMNTYQERLQKALERRSQTIQKLASQIV